MENMRRRYYWKPRRYVTRDAAGCRSKRRTRNNSRHHVHIRDCTRVLDLHGISCRQPFACQNFTRNIVALRSVPFKRSIKPNLKGRFDIFHGELKEGASSSDTVPFSRYRPSRGTPRPILDKSSIFD